MAPRPAETSTTRPTDRRPRSSSSSRRTRSGRRSRRRSSHTRTTGRLWERTPPPPPGRTSGPFRRPARRGRPGIAGCCRSHRRRRRTGSRPERRWSGSRSPAGSRSCTCRGLPGTDTEGRSSRRPPTPGIARGTCPGCTIPTPRRTRRRLPRRLRRRTPNRCCRCPRRCPRRRWSYRRSHRSGRPCPLRRHAAPPTPSARRIPPGRSPRRRRRRAPRSRGIRRDVSLVAPSSE
jgi:hypothetical protein